MKRIKPMLIFAAAAVIAGAASPVAYPQMTRFSDDFSERKEPNR